MSWQWSFWFRVPLTQQLKEDNAVTGRRLNNAATVLAMLILYAMHMGDVYMAYHKCCLRATFFFNLSSRKNRSSVYEVFIFHTCILIYISFNLDVSILEILLSSKISKRTLKFSQIFVNLFPREFKDIANKDLLKVL